VLSKLRARLTYANVMATVAVFLALGGSSYAAFTVTGNDVKDSSLTGKDIRNSSLTGKDVKSSSLTTSDVRNSSLLAADFKSGQLPAGPKGEPATRLWASINGNGTLRAGRGVVSVARQVGSPSGDYFVTFNRDVNSCAWSATSANHPGAGTATDPGVGLSGFNGGASIRVQIRNGGTLADNPVDLAVFC
jgi:hypothetical protein